MRTLEISIRQTQEAQRAIADSFVKMLDELFSEYGVRYRIEGIF